MAAPKPSLSKDRLPVLFVGAGVSLPAPASLPLFGHLRQALLDGLELGGVEERLVNHIAPESLLYYLGDSGAPIKDILLQVLSSGAPNAVHYALANAIQSGVAVWTTNADELIEEACGFAPGDPLLAVRKHRQQDLGKALLFKIHGTIRKPDSLLFQTPDVLGPPPRDWTDRFLDIVAGSELIIAGYAGADPDIRPLLARAFNLASAVWWLELPESCKRLEHRFQEAIAKLELHVVPVTNPSAALVYILKDLGFTGRSDLENQLNDTQIRPLDLSHWQLQQFLLAQGRLLEHVGHFEEASRRYLGSVFRSAEYRTRSILRLCGVGLYQGRAWARPLRKLVQVAAATSWPWRNHFMTTLHCRLLEKEGSYSDALNYAVRAYRLLPDDIARALDICAPARKLGRVELAERLARRALNRLRTDAQPAGDLMSRALFEMIYALRIRGKTEEARNELKRFSGDLDLYGGPNWIAWALCQEGCLRILDRTSDGAPEDLLRESIELFRDLADFHKVAAVQGNLVTALRARKAYVEARNELDRAKHFRERVARRSVFEDEALSFEEAEIFRALGFGDRASKIYENLTSSESGIHRMLGLLGLASQYQNQRGIRLAESALRLARRQGVAFGVVQGYVRLSRAGEMDEDAAVNSIGKAIRYMARSKVEELYFRYRSESALIFPS